jgi:hypothetical protein
MMAPSGYVIGVGHASERSLLGLALKASQFEIVLREV